MGLFVGKMIFFSNNLRLTVRFSLEYPNNDKHQLPQRDDKNSDIAPYYGYYEAVMSIYIIINDFLYFKLQKKIFAIIFIIMALNISAKKT